MSVAVPSLRAVLQSAYSLSASDGAWLHGIAAAVERAFGCGLGTIAVRVDARDPSRVETVDVASTVPYPRLHDWLEETFRVMDREYVNRGFAKMAGMVSQDDGLSQPGIVSYLGRVGAGDILTIIASDPSCTGILVNVHQPTPRALEPAQQDTLVRISTHIASAFHLRADLSTEESAAVFRADGRMVHANDETREVEDALRLAVRAAHQLNVQPARAEQSLAELTSRVDARWTVLSQFSEGAEEYIVARNNRAHSFRLSVLEKLTVREREVVSSLLLGRSQKVVAYELGLAHSTVRVHVSRAMAKLGVESIEEIAELVSKSS